MKVILLPLISLMVPGCIHSNAARVREELPLSVGFTGVQYRPNSMIGVGLGVDVLINPADFCMEISRVECGKEVFDGTEFRGSSRGFAMAPYVNFFPWETSHFFFGAGLSLQKRASTMEKTVTGEKFRYSTQALYAVPAAGWNWIWENGFSLFLALGYGFRMDKSRSLESDFTPSARKAADSFDDRQFTPITQSSSNGSGLIGWSFAL